MSYLVMGVSGCGKSTIGKLLASRLHLHFIDADDYHVPSSVEKMRNGIPLTDEDRWAWLQRLNQLLRQAEATGQEVVMACSALKESYRQMLRDGLEQPLKLIFLHGSKEVLLRRLGNREGHFMPSSLLESQLQTLEIPTYGLSVDIDQIPEVMVDQILQHYAPEQKAVD